MKDPTTFVRVKRDALQRLRLAIVCRGEPERGALSREASLAILARANEILTDCPESVRETISGKHEGGALNE